MKWPHRHAVLCAGPVENQAAGRRDSELSGPTGQGNLTYFCKVCMQEAQGSCYTEGEDILIDVLIYQIVACFANKISVEEWHARQQILSRSTGQAHKIQS